MGDCHHCQALCMKIKGPGKRPFTYFNFRLNIFVSNLYQVDEIFTVSRKRKLKVPSDYVKSLRKLNQNCSMWFTECVGDINQYLKENVYYLDLPCVATIYLLLVIEFKVSCIGFLKVFLSLFLHITNILDMIDMIFPFELTSIVQTSSQKL